MLNFYSNITQIIIKNKNNKNSDILSKLEFKTEISQ